MAIPFRARHDSSKPFLKRAHRHVLYPFVVETNHPGPAILIQSLRCKARATTVTAVPACDTVHGQPCGSDKSDSDDFNDWRSREGGLI